MKQATHQRFADGEQKFDRFDGLRRSDDPRQYAEHSGFGATRNTSGFRRLGKQAAVTWAAEMRGKHRCLSIKPKNGAVDVWFPRKNTNVVRQIAGREIIRAVDDDVVVSDDLAGVRARQPAIMQFDFDIRVYIAQTVPR